MHTEYHNTFLKHWPTSYVPQLQRLTSFYLKCVCVTQNVWSCIYIVFGLCRKTMKIPCTEALWWFWVQSSEKATVCWQRHSVQRMLTGWKVVLNSKAQKACKWSTDSDCSFCFYIGAKKFFISRDLCWNFSHRFFSPPHPVVLTGHHLINMLIFRD